MAGIRAKALGNEAVCLSLGWDDLVRRSQLRRSVMTKASTDIAGSLLAQRPRNFSTTIRAGRSCSNWRPVRSSPTAPRPPGQGEPFVEGRLCSALRVGWWEMSVMFG